MKKDFKIYLNNKLNGRSASNYFNVVKKFEEVNNIDIYKQMEKGVIFHDKKNRDNKLKYKITKKNTEPSELNPGLERYYDYYLQRQYNKNNNIKISVSKNKKIKKRNFIPIYENYVVNKTIDYLKDEGYEIENCCLNRQKGNDIVAYNDKYKIIIEAKGNTSQDENSNRYGEPFDKGQRDDHIGRAIYKLNTEYYKEKNSNDKNKKICLFAIALPNDNNHKATLEAQEPILKLIGYGVYLCDENGKVTEHIKPREIKLDNELLNTINNRDQKISELNNTVNDKDQQISELNNTVNNRDQQISELNNIINEQNNWIKNLNLKENKIKKISKLQIVEILMLFIILLVNLF